MSYSKLLLATAAIAIATAGCSSGGGSRTPVTTTTPTTPPPSPPPPPPTNFDTAEYQRQPALAQINAIDAYERGALGSGAIIAIIDSGIDLNNPEFSGRIDPRSADLLVAGVVGPSQQRPGGPDLQDTDGHGTAVAGIAAAAKNDIGAHGVAPQATLLIFRGDDPNDPESYPGGVIFEAARRAVSAGADVFSLSLGSNEPTARDDFARLFDITSQGDVVTVLAAGNDSTVDPDASAQAASDARARGTAIAAGAVDANNNIASFSARAGNTADFFLAAPGVRLRTVDDTGNASDTIFFSGTSAATPVIAGAAALIRGFWPQLTAQETVEILFTTATDLGATGTDPIYGRGLLNVGAALQPVGTPTTSSPSGVSFALSSPGVATFSPVFGAVSLSLGDYVFLDAFGRDFTATAPTSSFRADLLNADPFDVIRPDRSVRQETISLAGGIADFAVVETDPTLSTGAAALRAPSFLTQTNTPTDTTLSASFMQTLGEDVHMRFVTGFSPRHLDRLAERSANIRSFARDGDGDAFLPAGDAVIGAAVNFALLDELTAEMLISQSNAEIDQTDALFGPVSAAGEASVSNARLVLGRAFGPIETRIGFGLRSENGGPFSSTLDGVFGGAGKSVTTYQSVEIDAPLAYGWRAKALGAAGQTSADASAAGFFSGFENLTTTHFKTALYKRSVFAAGDAISIAAIQPLRIEAGAVAFDVPGAYDLSTDSLVFDERRFGLSSAHREIDIELSYLRPIGGGAYLEAAALHQENMLGTDRAATSVFLRTGWNF